ncbi:16S rRNA (guanine(966)-N(2))-methyltransferase RsmD [Marinihelvus fidelis]|uniref:Ribosomal RNA small subunit methyltransferase D n=1 Tax=Marinihelvus fidelis TaxID=2613842 RepID=A0A5N0T749_9GAMM|nr:16S rRNA (guanine(966)-N(2))-methyltransferase RsmD [Marinihelvus fidelis]KAA9130875.1 16S rRNA (guanine(966)-N(2))-methyltransferase RsmD [Marinihelvus fidelis]
MKRKPPGQVRIIGGEWRGRKLPVPDLPGLRPTGDRSRETLFNWLQADVPGARCADLFAGSGALGFEAASRGARHVDMVEIAPLAVSSLAESRATLRADNVDIHRANVLAWLRQAEPDSLDIIFLDPPFDSGLAVQALERIQDNGCVAPGGCVYVESPSKFPELVMRAPFALARDKVVGESRLQLFRRG